MNPSITVPHFNPDCTKALYLCDYQGSGRIYVVDFNIKGEQSFRRIFRFNDEVSTYQLNNGLNSIYYFEEAQRYSDRNVLMELIRTDKYSFRDAVENIALLLTEEIVTTAILSDSCNVHGIETLHRYN